MGWWEGVVSGLSPCDVPVHSGAEISAVCCLSTCVFEDCQHVCLSLTVVCLMVVALGLIIACTFRDEQEALNLARREQELEAALGAAVERPDV